MKIYGHLNPIAVLGYTPPKHILETIQNRAVRLDFDKYNRLLSHIGQLTLELSTTTIDKGSNFNI